jgi:hypothetical protein
LTCDFWAVFEEKNCKGKKQRRIFPFNLCVFGIAKGRRQQREEQKQKADPPPAAKDDN